MSPHPPHTASPSNTSLSVIRLRFCPLYCRSGSSVAILDRHLDVDVWFITAVVELDVTLAGCFNHFQRTVVVIILDVNGFASTRSLNYVNLIPIVGPRSKPIQQIACFFVTTYCANRPVATKSFSRSLLQYLVLRCAYQWISLRSGAGANLKVEHMSGAMSGKKFLACPPLYGSTSTIIRFGERFCDVRAPDVHNSSGAIAKIFYRFEPALNPLLYSRV